MASNTRGKNHKPVSAGARVPSSAPMTQKAASLFAEHQRVAVDSLARLFGEIGASALTWAVIGIALALPVCMLLFLQNVQQVNTDLDEAANISLFMSLDLSPERLQETKDRLESHAGVGAVVLITPDQGLEDFQRYSGFGDALDGLDENPLPAVLEVTPDSVEAEAILALAEELSAWEGVDNAQYDAEWLQRLYGFIALAERLTLALTALLCAGVILVVGNTVRLAIENRRAEIVVVKLVGGTDAYVARPFLYTGLWYGVGGGLVAMLLVLIAFWFLKGPISIVLASYDSDYTLVGLNVTGLALLLAVSGGLGLAGAWVSVIRHLRRIEPR